jgi:hypothetical protein
VEAAYLKQVDAFLERLLLITHIVGWEAVRGKDAWEVETWRRPRWGGTQRRALGRARRGEEEGELAIVVFPRLAYLHQFLEVLKGVPQVRRIGLLSSLPGLRVAGRLVAERELLLGLAFLGRGWAW